MHSSYFTMYLGSQFLHVFLTGFSQICISVLIALFVRLDRACGHRDILLHILILDKDQF